MGRNPRLDTTSRHTSPKNPHPQKQSRRNDDATNHDHGDGDLAGAPDDYALRRRIQALCLASYAFFVLIAGQFAAC